MLPNGSFSFVCPIYKEAWALSSLITW
jgi:hypothetical protein